MASVVDTTVKNFNSTMVNSAVLNGVIGSLIPLLDACLVTGFDTKPLTSLVVVSGVATATFTGLHSAQLDSVVLIAGVTGPLVALNGEQKITVALGMQTVKFATAAPDGTAAGTITMKMAPAGWAKVFTATNLAVYQSPDPTSTKMFLRVDDTTTTTVRVTGYEQMADVNNGTGLFPSALQSPGGGYWVKSTVANTVGVPWSIVGDSKFMYFTTCAGASSSLTALTGITRCFGDPIAFKPNGDAFGCVLNYSIIVPSSPQTMVESALGHGQTAQFASPRNYTGLGSSNLGFRYTPLGTATSGSGADTTYGTFPNPVDGALYLGKIFLNLRSEFPGILCCPQSQLFNTFKSLDRITGSGPFSGRVLQAYTCGANNTSVNAGSESAYTGILFFDITGPWR